MKHTIIFLPGLLCDERLFAAQTAKLAEKADCRVVTLDFAGTVGELAAGVLAQAPDRFSLAALSMGGYVAFEVIRQLAAKGEGERLQKLVLMNTSARADTEDQRKTRHGLIKLSKMGKFKGVTPRLMPNLLSADALQNPAITGTITAMAEAIGQAGFVRQQEAILSRPNSRDLLPQIKVPTMVIGGTEDKLTPPPVVSEIASGIAGAELDRKSVV